MASNDPKLQISGSLNGGGTKSSEIQENLSKSNEFSHLKNLAALFTEIHIP